MDERGVRVNHKKERKEAGAGSKGTTFTGHQAGEGKDRNHHWSTETPKVQISDGIYKSSPKKQKHTTVSIRWSSPTQLLIRRSKAYVWQSGRDAQFSLVCGRM